MIKIEDLYRSLIIFRPVPDNQQREVIEQNPDESLFIVAGPGTGKTTCLTLRILKLILVDAIPPRAILATTFTKKAAGELRSRILGWGFRVIDILLSDPNISPGQKTFLRNVDINQVWTGTIDSLCEQLLTEYRTPGTHPPILADDFISKTLILREGLFMGRRFENHDLDTLLLPLHNLNSSAYGYHIGTKTELLQEIWDHRFQDQIDWDSFLQNCTPQEQPSRLLISEALESYETALSDRGMVDFALLENELLRRLSAGELTDFTDNLRVVLVDEYQDTNLLQERIYFELAKACNGALTVVGDDDQSLYRFRGATVELFSNFAQRYRAVFRRQPHQVFLSNNYRSSRNIINFVNNYVTLDREFQNVRVASKPPLSFAPNAQDGIPILGMFRDSTEKLSEDLAQFINQVFRGPGYHLPNGMTLSREPERGDLGDCALLCSSPTEYFFGKARFPLLLRQKLAEQNPSILVFNPRGEDLCNIPIISIFGGLLIECIDSGGVIESQIRGLSPEAQAVFQRWRTTAINYVQSSEAPQGLLRYAVSWANRDPGRQGYVWPRTLPVLELIYGLVHFFPELYNDPEGQVFLEVFTRQLTACEQIGKFRGRLITDPDNEALSEASVKELIRDFLEPIAAGTIKVNEELIETFPRDRLSILSIHQSKGLEFPMIIVDVGSEFKTNNHLQAKKRFPTHGEKSHRLEDLLRPYSPLQTQRRTQEDRAFDDLFRQFFVAYSRPQDVLVLVGLTHTLPNGRVPNVAMGRDRQGTSHWLPPNMPFIRI